MKRRGISPLIATILLVGFTIAIAAIVSSFLINQVEDEFKPDLIIKDSEFCSSVSIGYTYENTEYYLAQDGNPTTNNGYPNQWLAEDKGEYIFLYGFNITNKGAFNITNLTLKVDPGLPSYTMQIYDYSLDTPDALATGIPPRDSREVRIIYKSTEDTAIAEFIPWMKDFSAEEDNVYIVCNDRKLRLDLKSVCQKAATQCEDQWEGNKNIPFTGAPFN